MIEYVQLADIQVPTGDQVKNTVDSYNNLVAAVKAFMDSAGWIVPTVLYGITQAAAAIKGVNNIWLVKWIAGNWGHAE